MRCVVLFSLCHWRMFVSSEVLNLTPDYTWKEGINRCSAGKAIKTNSDLFESGIIYIIIVTNTNYTD